MVGVLLKLLTIIYNKNKLIKQYINLRGSFQLNVHKYRL